jgi:hypothetical protein
MSSPSFLCEQRAWEEFTILVFVEPRALDIAKFQAWHEMQLWSEWSARAGKDEHANLHYGCANKRGRDPGFSREEEEAAGAQ